MFALNICNDHQKTSPRFVNFSIISFTALISSIPELDKCRHHLQVNVIKHGEVHFILFLKREINTHLIKLYILIYYCPGEIHWLI